MRRRFQFIDKELSPSFYRSSLVNPGDIYMLCSFGHRLVSLEPMTPVEILSTNGKNVHYRTEGRVLGFLWREKGWARMEQFHGLVCAEHQCTAANKEARYEEVST